MWMLRRSWQSIRSFAGLASWVRYGRILYITLIRSTVLCIAGGSRQWNGESEMSKCKWQLPSSGNECVHVEQYSHIMCRDPGGPANTDELVRPGLSRLDLNAKNSIEIGVEVQALELYSITQDVRAASEHS